MLLNHFFSFQLNSDNTQSDANTREFWVNMPNLMTHLKKVSEQKPQATYYNVDMLKYQVSLIAWQGISSTVHISVLKHLMLHTSE
jgi:hypothetical protein